jgi:hypothetical protein
VLRELTFVSDVTKRQSPLAYSNVLDLARLYATVQKESRLTFEEVQYLREQGFDMFPYLKRVLGKTDMTLVMWLQSGLITAKHFDAVLQAATDGTDRHQ